MTDNSQDNNNRLNNRIISYLINYLIENRDSSKRETTTTRLNPDVMDKFFSTCRKLRLTNKAGIPNRRACNIALEGLIQYFNETFNFNEPIQTMLFGEQPKKPELNIASRLELNMIKKDLGNLIDALENRRGHPDFLEGKLRETLPKAIRIYEDTRDSELEDLLVKVERFV